MTVKTYRALTQAAVSSALGGEKVVVDATFLACPQRTEFYEACVKAGLSPFFVYCFADAGKLKRGSG